MRPSLVTDDIHAWIGVEANRSAGRLPSEFQLTDDERLLRDLAFPLIAPPYDRARWDSVLDEIGWSELLTPDLTPETPNYTAAMFAAHNRSPISLYAQLNDDIRNDVTRIGPFLDTARRVSDLDIKRKKSLAFVTDLAPYESVNALRRVSENTLIAAWVHRSLEGRAAQYRFALERLVITTPSNMAVDVERSLTLLKARIAQFRPVAPVAAVAGPAIVTKD
jgi:hypothetical protein